MILPPRSFLRPATSLVLSVLTLTAPALAADAPPGTPTVTLRPPPAVTGSNALVLEEVARASRGGGYSVAGGASQRLAAAFAAGGACQPGYSSPSFCSGATYVVFARVAGRLAGSEAERQRLASALAVSGQVDGVGVWGRWNANGPGTAALFHEARIGHNFTAWDQARPGDFAKLFWNDQIGVKERGHSVIFLGLENGPDGKERVRFWSSNKPGGYGEKSVPLSAVKRVIFSRLHPAPRLEGLARLPAADPYLASLNRVPTTAAAVSERIGCVIH